MLPYVAAPFFALEVVITFILMFVIKGVATGARAEAQMPGLAIGGAVAMFALFAGPLTGAPMNPALPSLLPRP